jgi:hypothetical protein
MSVYHRDTERSRRSDGGRAVDRSQEVRLGLRNCHQCRLFPLPIPSVSSFLLPSLPPLPLYQVSLVSYSPNESALLTILI